jgi:methionyl-tRNA formyltransferase
MLMDESLDTGPILAQARCVVQPDDTAETLTRTLARLGAELLIEKLPHWLAGTITPQVQPQEGITVAGRLTKQDGRIDWSQPAEAIERMTRAYAPWPGTYTRFYGQLLRILRVRVLPDWSGPEPPGTVVALPDECVAVAAGRGALALEELQLAGKRALPPGPFCCGCNDFVGARLGDADATVPG